jgi:hypothetical protein
MLSPLLSGHRITPFKRRVQRSFLGPGFIHHHIGADGAITAANPVQFAASGLGIDAE